MKNKTIQKQDLGLFDYQNRLKKLSEAGSPLEKLDMPPIKRTLGLDFVPLDIPTGTGSQVPSGVLLCCNLQTIPAIAA